jgi:hypothetical protein
MEENGYVAVKMYKNSVDEYEIDATFYGDKPTRLLIKEKVYGFLLNKVYCHLLGLEFFETGRYFEFFGGKDEYWIATVEKINISGAIIKPFDSEVIDFSEFPYLEMLDVEGVIGREFLIKHHAVIDYSNEFLYLKIY